VLDTEPAAVDSALQRAHKTVDARLPAQSQQAAMRSLDDAELRAIVDGYVEAWERADVDAVVAMLAEDVTFAMPPQPAWYDGREAVAAFLAARPLAADTRWRIVPTRANGQLAFAHYAWDGSGFASHAIALVALRGREIEEMTVFRTPEALARFGLPPRLDGSA
jgi:ketosteroid isomerase-like protein